MTTAIIKPAVFNPFFSVENILSIFKIHSFLKLIRVLLILLLFSSIFMVFFQINMLAKDTGSLRQLESQFEKLGNKNQILNDEVLHFGQLLTKDELMQKLNLETTDSVKFIESSDVQIVRR